jgi:CpeS-like protein
MDIVEFFQLSSGKWFSQRTSHYPAQKKPESGKTDLYVDALESSDAIVLKLCADANIDPALAICALRSNWDGTVESQKEKLVGSSVLVAIASSDTSHSSTPHSGILLRANTPAQLANSPSAGQITLGQTLTGQYNLGSDEALTLITHAPDLQAEERIWFASPNLRLRTTLFTRQDGSSVTSFCSEIRMGGAKPQS